MPNQYDLTGNSKTTTYPRLVQYVAATNTYYDGLGNVITGLSGYSGSGVSGYSGYSGYSGISGYSGYSGYSGKSGATGSTGSTGVNGLDGVNSLRWKYDPTVANDERFYPDSTDLNTTTRIHISIYKEGNIDVTTWHNAAKTWELSNNERLLLKVTQVSNPNIFGIYRINDVVDNTTYFHYDVQTLIAANGSYSDGETYAISWIELGSSGISGYSGKSGYSGYSGHSGYSGVQANSYVTLPIVADVPAWTPVDGTIYFLGGGGVPGAAKRRRIYIWTAGTIEVATIWGYATTAGTGENISMYIRKNDSSDTLIQTEGIASNARNWKNTGLSIPVASGDYIEIKMVCPSWTTNPVFEVLNGYVLVKI